MPHDSEACGPVIRNAPTPPIMLPSPEMNVVSKFRIVQVFLCSPPQHYAPLLHRLNLIAYQNEIRTIDIPSNDGSS
ncbi:hypothetical protein PGT21_035612 [Puccinia graminis f. sp. tritici]|uniref:Uncharacterized protein n=1 Tax=Puccinia graminis f. sp. tritici TaxID=56615 RepID=A0A5B0PCH0_PUCGR|nr:hypothetical protein PGT21_035612 [Puccinia graminis f. sp. tritici]